MFERLVRPALATLFLLNLLLNFSFGQTLLTNGNFETGSHAPWVATGNTAINSIAIQGQFSCSFGFDGEGASFGRIEQTIATEIGTIYYLSLDLANAQTAEAAVTLAGTPAAGGPADGTRVIPNFKSADGTHYTLFFTASSTSTTVSILIEGGFLADNIRLVALPPHPKAGRYAGVAKAELSSEENEVAVTSSSKVVARLKSTGQIVLFRDGVEVGAGIILPDNTMDLRIGNRVQTTEVTFRGSKLSFILPGSTLARDEGSNPLDSVQQTTFILTRVGR